MARRVHAGRRREASMKPSFVGPWVVPGLDATVIADYLAPSDRWLKVRNNGQQRRGCQTDR